MNRIYVAPEYLYRHQKCYDGDGKNNSELYYQILLNKVYFCFYRHLFNIYDDGKGVLDHNSRLDGPHLFYFYDYCPISTLFCNTY